MSFIEISIRLEMMSQSRSICQLFSKENNDQNKVGMYLILHQFDNNNKVYLWHMN